MPQADGSILKDNTVVKEKLETAFLGTIEQAITRVDGLDKVDNTSDLEKPISTVQQQEFNNRIPIAEKGVPNGVATYEQLEIKASRFSALTQTVLQNVITVIGSNPTTIILDRTIPITSALTIPANIKIDFVPGATFNISTGILLNILSPINITNQQLFSGDGNVTGLQISRPEWFGAKNNGVTDDTIALQKSCDSSKTIYLSRYLGYVISQPIKVKGYSKIYSDSYLDQNTLNNPNIKYIGTGDLFTTTDITNPGSGVCIEFDHLILDGNSTNNGLVSGIQRLTVNKVLFRNFSKCVRLMATDSTDVVESRFTTCYFIDSNNGIYREEGSSKNPTDGFIQDCIFRSCAYPINMTKVAGWLIQGNHLYGGNMIDAIVMTGFANRIIDNYIEPFSGIGINYKLTEAAGEANTIIGRNQIFMKNGATGVRLESLVNIGDTLLVSENIINTTGGTTTGTVGIALAGAFNIIGSLLHNTIKNVVLDISTGSGLSPMRSVQITQSYYKFTGLLGLHLSNGTRIREDFGKPTTTALPFGSVSHVYNAGSGVNTDIGTYQYLPAITNGWKKNIALDRRLDNAVAIPTFGTWIKGDIVLKKNTDVDLLYAIDNILIGWYRLTDSNIDINNNVLDTDWKELRVLTSQPNYTKITTYSINGNGSSTLNIPHGLGYTPKISNILSNNNLTPNVKGATADFVNFILYFNEPTVNASPYNFNITYSKP